MKKLGLSTRVFIGFGLGILLGVIFGEKVLVIKIIGDIFLKLIKMLTVPLVFFSIISGITNLTDVNKLKRVGAKILGMYVVTTLLAGFIGLGIAHLINPGIGFQIDSSAIGSYEATAMNSVSDTLLAMVPDNIINAMANTNMMGIIIFCAIFGCAMVMLGTKVSVVKDFIVQTTDIMYKMTAIIMETSPFGRLRLDGLCDWPVRHKDLWAPWQVHPLRLSQLRRHRLCHVLPDTKVHGQGQVPVFYAQDPASVGHDRGDHQLLRLSARHHAHHAR